MAKKADNRTAAQKEEAELESAYKKVTGGKFAKKSKGSSFEKKRIMFIVAISIAVVVLIAGLILGYFFFFSGVTPGQILNNVTVAGVDVGGMSKSEAIQAVEDAIGDSYANESMVVQLMENSIELTPALTGVTLDVEAAVDAAYAYGRTGSTSQRKSEQLQAATGGIQADITSCLTLDTDAIQAELNKLISDTCTPLTQTAYEITGERPELTYDPNAGEEAAEPEETEGTESSTEEAPAQMLVITMGTRECAIELAALLDQVLNAYGQNVFLVEADCKVTEPDALDLDALYNENCVDPVDAVMDTETFEVTPHSNGWRFDLENVKKLLEEAEYGQKLEIPFTLVAAEVTYDSLMAQLFKDELSSYSTTGSYSSDRNTNLRLACESINGIILNPGDTFDYNDALGERTPERGYKQGASYMGSETVYTYGGGICQVSSTLYYCALMADMEIVTRVEHGFPSSYIPLGMDATVSWGGPEFRFRNNADYPIRIEAYSEGATVHIKLVGTDTKDYYVKMEYSVLETYPWETVYEEMDEATAKEEGYEDGETITTPYTGYLVKTYRCKYSKATDELLSRDYEASSQYNRRDKKVCKIVKPEQPTETVVPETTTPPETTVPPETTTPPETGVPGSGGGI